MSFLSRYREYSKRDVRVDVRILSLSFVFFGLGLVFFYLGIERSTDKNESASSSIPLAEVKERALPALQSYPDPSTFASFVYTATQKELSLPIICADTYYVVLFFSATTDYREHPLDAKYNTATPCTVMGATNIVIPLSGIPLEEGKRYYSVRADQGTSGGWYNPY